MAFTTAKRALSFQQKRAFIQEILFSFFKWDTLAQKKVGGGTWPQCPTVPVSHQGIAGLNFCWRPFYGLSGSTNLETFCDLSIFIPSFENYCFLYLIPIRKVANNVFLSLILVRKKQYQKPEIS